MTSASAPPQSQPPAKAAAGIGSKPSSSSHSPKSVVSPRLPLSPLLGIQSDDERDSIEEQFQSISINPSNVDYIDVDQVKAAWKAVCAAEPMLRTVFTSSQSSAGGFQQIILKSTEPYVSYATVDPQAKLNAIRNTIEEAQFAAAQPQH
ncbi:hypothetical protein EKO04_011635 [Ascochyta lentis]|uniref:Uncharacterized protein n=1 Tax=Ascochyta lentis TaxID=205686 RepID=A0A8H7MD69_9PLEO|nr:hypothetical protein EKO04_011635 [Ascochyta lentis]